jgi:hypothetical protein
MTAKIQIFANILDYFILIGFALKEPWAQQVIALFVK